MDLSKIAAWWGALVATIVFFWDVYKWRTDGPRLSLRVLPNTEVIGVPKREGKTWVSVTISNNGNRPTTLKGIGFEHYDTVLDRIRGKVSKAAVFENHNADYPLPLKINPGEEWTGLVPQLSEDDSTSLDEMAKNGHLMIWTSQSHTQRSIRVRLIIKGES